MADMRAVHVKKMNDIKAAIAKTKSPYLKRDYLKAYKKLENELRTYDHYHQNRER